MKKRLILVALALAAVLAMTAVAGAGTGANSDTSTANRATVDTTRALVVLQGAPLSTSEKTRPAPGRKIDFNNSGVRAYRAELAALRNEFKQWLRANAPAAKVTREFDIALNAVGVELNGTPLATIKAAPMAVDARYQGIYYPAGHNDPDLALVSAVQAWQSSTDTGAKGRGVKVAILDTGIDQRHPCFADGNPRDDGAYTNDKVIVAKVFNEKTPARGYTPKDYNGHGTHVAGTVACNMHTSASVDGATIPYGVSGVAPEATLGNYNVFPGDVLSVRWEDLVEALEEAYEDGFDVANMSIGGGYEGILDLGSIAVDNLDVAGMVSAVAAGNSGPGFNTVEAPGRAARALTAGAMTVGHSVVMYSVVGGTSYAAVRGDFGKPSTDTTAPLKVVFDSTSPEGGLSLACSSLPANSLTGKIALISRGTCTFSTKIRNAQAAGATGVIVVNRVAGDPITMGQDGTANQPTIPAYMVALQYRSELMGKDAQSATLQATGTYVRNAGVDNWMASFSSHGPTEVDFRVKPDVVAPGVNVLSAQPLEFCGGLPCWAFYQGTSMATPHLAGAAAVVKGQHPTWSAAQIRSAIVNQADEHVTRTTNGSALESNVLVRGAGRANVLSAVSAPLALDPVSVSFGAVPSGSGISLTRSVAVTSFGGPSVASVAIDSGSNGVSYAASFANGVVTITMTAAKGAAVGDHPAILRVRDASGAELAHAAVYTLIK